MTSKWNGAPGTTPGPWLADVCEKSGLVVILGKRGDGDVRQSDGLGILFDVDCSVDRDALRFPGMRAEQVANAHQAKASGALYDATELLDSLCAWMLHRFGPDSPEGREASLRQAKAIAALALARGAS